MITPKAVTPKMDPMVKTHLMIRAHPTRDLALRGRTIKVVCLVSLAMAKIIPKKTPKNDNSASDESADEPEKQRDPMAWQSQLDATKLDASIAVETDKIDALENNQLPAEIPATLRVSFELTPGEDGLLKDDWIETTLPSFLSFENASLKCFALMLMEPKQPKKLQMPK